MSTIRAQFFFFCLLLDTVQLLYQTPGSLRVLQCILVVPRTALFWAEISEVAPRICWSHSPSLGLMALTTGTTVAFTPHLFNFLLQALVFF